MAVRKGRQPGIYLTWAECAQQVHGYPNAVYKKFPTFFEAQHFNLVDTEARGGPQRMKEDDEDGLGASFQDLNISKKHQTGDVSESVVPQRRENTRTDVLNQTSEEKSKEVIDASSTILNLQRQVAKSSQLKKVNKEVIIDGLTWLKDRTAGDDEEGKEVIDNIIEIMKFL
ncbi:unnamed protein product [Mucor hiemalis]